MMHYDFNSLIKYKNYLLYILFGVLTTIVNAVTYYCASFIYGCSTASGTILAWLTAVIFAYITNKIWVFNSRSWSFENLIKEFSSFMICRIATGLGDLTIMVILVDFLNVNGLASKILSNIFVVITNYLASQMFVFKKA